MSDHQYGSHSSGGRPHLGTHPLTEDTCDYSLCWCRDFGGAPKWTGNVMSDGKNTYSIDCGTYPMPPLLYTQAQVDALVKAAKEQCAVMLEDEAVPMHSDDKAELADRMRICK